ncbi:Ros/MucR family transcriptional regulator [Mesorhizobium sp. A623]
MSDTNNDAIVELTADVTSAYVSNNPVAVSELPALISQVHQSLSGLTGTATEPTVDPHKPAVNPKKSVHDDFIICLEDGKKFKSLKRHLMTHFSLSPDEYRVKWNLPSDYPMVAPAYAAARSALAKSMGLGRKPKEAAPAPAPKKRAPRKAKAAA